MDRVTTYAAPFFIFMMLAEYFYSRRKHVRLYRFGDTLANLSLGLGSQLTGLVIAGVTAIAYRELYSWFHWLELPAHGLATGIVAFLGVDLGYYWYHRASHRISFMWATHVVHHQSEEYNLSVALRQSWFSGLFSWIFYLPLAVIGVPMNVFLLHSGVNLVLQFWIHTKVIDRLEPLEWVLNTPSHHRVHHGTNAQYIDKNYAGVLIIWDRLFASFEPEHEAVTYGSFERFRRISPVAANSANWIGIIALMSKVRGLDKLRAWIREPGWHPADLQIPEKPKACGEAFAYESHPLALYVAVQFLCSILGTFAFLLGTAHWAISLKLVAITLLIWHMASFSHLLESRPSAVPREQIRLISLIAFAIAGIGFEVILVPIALVCTCYAIASFAWLVCANGQANISPLMGGVAEHR